MPATPRSAHVAASLRDQQEHVIQLWVERVCDEVEAAKHLNRNDLVDSLPVLLTNLQKTLETGESSELVAQSTQVGLNHGGQRATLSDFSLNELLVEYRILRRTLFEVLRDGTQLSSAVEDLINDAIDRGIGNAASELMRVRRKQDQEMAQQLRVSEGRLRLVIDALPDLINFVDGKQRYQLTNKAYETWFGIPTDHLRGRKVREVLGEENYAQISPHIQSALSGEHVKHEAPFVFPEGRRGYIEATHVPEFDTSGRVLGFISHVSDISQRKQAEVEAQDRTAFEQQLIGIVSHDLKNPLSTILLNAQMLSQYEAVDDRQQKAVTRITSSAERAIRMVRDLLDFAQVRFGRSLPVQRNTLDIHTCTRQLVDEMRSLYPRRRVDLIQSGDGHGMWDPDRIAQIVTNLVSNALQYSPPTSTVSVTTRGGAAGVELQVHNEGPPIPEEALPKIFNPLERANDRLSINGRSVGLGLFITKHAVEAHGGSITVRSDAADGTTFTVHLPRTAE